MSKETKSSYPKGVRIVALVGAILLALMYLVTLISAVTTSPASPGLFKACLGGSIFLPIMLWLYIQFAKLFTNKNQTIPTEEEIDDEEKGNQ